jgi:hypothetical protein
VPQIRKSSEWDLQHRVRFRMARAMLRAAFRLLRPKRLYEPVEIGGKRFAEKRESEARWDAIASAIKHYHATSLLDIGCAEAWFLRRAAAEFGCFGIGVEADDRRVLVGEVARIHDSIERVAVIKARLSPDDIRSLPACEIVICLSVLHHVMRVGGMAAARDFVSALASCARKALIFEMGTSDEASLAWTSQLPDMPKGQEAFVRSLLLESGFANVRVVASTPGLVRDAPRLLFVAEPALTGSGG